MERDAHGFNIEILPQPDDTTCGPTCLHAVYKYYGDNIELKKVIEEVHAFEGGGTLAVWLACHALKRGYDATIYTYNLQVFDPTWLQKTKVDVVQRLLDQITYKNDPKLRLATRAYIEFLELGGQIKLDDLTRDLLRRHLLQNIPVLSGLSSTFLYRSPREYGTKQPEFDDIRGEPAGHFVILCGYDRTKKLVTVADPLHTNPFSPTQKYETSIDRVLCSILLGVITYDANFLIIRPRT
jgi:hypothetical protein